MHVKERKKERKKGRNTKTVKFKIAADSVV
jgi:hypothetical protein